MSRLFNQSLAICAALFLTLGSIGTIISVPAAQAHTSPTIAPMIALA
ncbi:hypothetical protein [Erythrobacter insulae]|nr:hypothetical protein [Erythrobacter insulae]